MCNEKEPEGGRPLFGSAFNRLWKTAGLPALVYLGVALGLPLMNGAWLKYGADFWKHAFATCVTLVMLVGMLLILELAWHWIFARVRRQP